MFLESTTLWREFPEIHRPPPRTSLHTPVKGNQLTPQCRLGINGPIDREHLSVVVTVAWFCTPSRDFMEGQLFTEEGLKVFTDLVLESSDLLTSSSLTIISSTP